MQTKVTITRKMTVPAEKVWDAIAKIGRLHVWFPSISTCVVEGSGVGAVRRMDLTRGGKIVDHVVDIEPEKMRLSYERVESPFAVTSYRGTVEVLNPSTALVWSSGLSILNLPRKQSCSQRTAKGWHRRRGRGHGG